MTLPRMLMKKSMTTAFVEHNDSQLDLSVEGEVLSTEVNAFAYNLYQLGSIHKVLSSPKKLLK